MSTQNPLTLIQALSTEMMPPSIDRHFDSQSTNYAKENELKIHQYVWFVYVDKTRHNPFRIEKNKSGLISSYGFSLYHNTVFGVSKTASTRKTSKQVELVSRHVRYAEPCLQQLLYNIPEAELAALVNINGATITPASDSVKPVPSFYKFMVQPAVNSRALDLEFVVGSDTEIAKHRLPQRKISKVIAPLRDMQWRTYTAETPFQLKNASGALTLSIDNREGRNEYGVIAQSVKGQNLAYGHLVYLGNAFALSKDEYAYLIDSQYSQPSTKYHEGTLQLDEKGLPVAKETPDYTEDAAPLPDSKTTLTPTGQTPLAIKKEADAPSPPKEYVYTSSTAMDIRPHSYIYPTHVVREFDILDDNGKVKMVEDPETGRLVKAGTHKGLIEIGREYITFKRFNSFRQTSDNYVTSFRATLLSGATADRYARIEALYYFNGELTKRPRTFDIGQREYQKLIEASKLAKPTAPTYYRIAADSLPVSAYPNRGVLEDFTDDGTGQGKVSVKLFKQDLVVLWPAWHSDKLFYMDVVPNVKSPQDRKSPVDNRFMAPYVVDYGTSRIIEASSTGDYVSPKSVNAPDLAPDAATPVVQPVAMTYERADFPELNSRREQELSNLDDGSRLAANKRAEELNASQPDVAYDRLLLHSQIDDITISTLPPERLVPPANLEEQPAAIQQWFAKCADYHSYFDKNAILNPTEYTWYVYNGDPMQISATSPDDTTVILTVEDPAQIVYSEHPTPQQQENSIHYDPEVNQVYTLPLSTVIVAAQGSDIRQKCGLVFGVSKSLQMFSDSDITYRVVRLAGFYTQPLAFSIAHESAASSLLDAAIKQSYRVPDDCVLAMRLVIPPLADSSIRSMPTVLPFRHNYRDEDFIVAHQVARSFQSHRLAAATPVGGSLVMGQLPPTTVPLSGYATLALTLPDAYRKVEGEDQDEDEDEDEDTLSKKPAADATRIEVSKAPPIFDYAKAQLVTPQTESDIVSKTHMDVTDASDLDAISQLTEQAKISDAFMRKHKQLRGGITLHSLYKDYDQELEDKREQARIAAQLEQQRIDDAKRKEELDRRIDEFNSVMAVSGIPAAVYDKDGLTDLSRVVTVWRSEKDKTLLGAKDAGISGYEFIATTRATVPMLQSQVNKELKHGFFPQGVNAFVHLNPETALVGDAARKARLADWTVRVKNSIDSGGKMVLDTSTKPARNLLQLTVPVCADDNVVGNGKRILWAVFTVGKKNTPVLSATSPFIGIDTLLGKDAKGKANFAKGTLTAFGFRDIPAQGGQASLTPYDLSDSITTILTNPQLLHTAARLTNTGNQGVVGMSTVPSALKQEGVSTHAWLEYTSDTRTGKLASADDYTDLQTKMLDLPYYSGLEGVGTSLIGEDEEDSASGDPATTSNAVPSLVEAPDLSEEEIAEDLANQQLATQRRAERAAKLNEIKKAKTQAVVAALENNDVGYLEKKHITGDAGSDLTRSPDEDSEVARQNTLEADLVEQSKREKAVEARRRREEFEEERRLNHNLDNPFEGESASGAFFTRMTGIDLSYMCSIGNIVRFNEQLLTKSLSASVPDPVVVVRQYNKDNSIVMPRYTPDQKQMLTDALTHSEGLKLDPRSYYLVLDVGQPEETRNGYPIISYTLCNMDYVHQLVKRGMLDRYQRALDDAAALNKKNSQQSLSGALALLAQAVKNHGEGFTRIRLSVCEQYRMSSVSTIKNAVTLVNLPMYIDQLIDTGVTAVSQSVETKDGVGVKYNQTYLNRFTFDALTSQWYRLTNDFNSRPWNELSQEDRVNLS